MEEMGERGPLGQAVPQKQRGRAASRAARLSESREMAPYGEIGFMCARRRGRGVASARAEGNPTPPPTDAAASFSVPVSGRFPRVAGGERGAGVPIGLAFPHLTGQQVYEMLQVPLPGADIGSRARLIDPAFQRCAGTLPRPAEGRGLSVMMRPSPPALPASPYTGCTASRRVPSARTRAPPSYDRARSPCRIRACRSVL
jgi:hypothetical protein